MRLLNFLSCIIQYHEKNTILNDKIQKSHMKTWFWILLLLAIFALTVFKITYSKNKKNQDDEIYPLW